MSVMALSVSDLGMIRDNLLVLPRFNVLKTRIQRTDSFKVFMFDQEKNAEFCLKENKEFKKLCKELDCTSKRDVTTVLYIAYGFDHLFAANQFAYAVNYGESPAADVLKMIKEEGLPWSKGKFKSMSEATLISEMTSLHYNLFTGAGRMFCDHLYSTMLDDLIYIMRSEIFHF